MRRISAIVHWREMKTQRIWIEIVLVGSAISVALALLLASIGAAAGIPEAHKDAFQPQAAAAQKADTPDQVFDGMVTCSRCGARHSPALQRPATVCVRVCVHGGAAFALVGADSSYVLQGDLEVLKPFAGERARVVGTLSGHTILVRSVKAES
jgi:hypothetical protein